MNNLIYEGSVLHHRFRPRQHMFTYKVNYYFLDLENIPSVIQTPPFLTFNPKNYLTSKEIKSQIKNKFGPDLSSKINKIFILTQLSYLGFCFNPVSFYYCYDKMDNLIYIVSLITNTPWGEKNLNIFEYKKNMGGIHFKKDFHVSPFMPMEIDYTWNFTVPESSLQIQMFNQLEEETNPFFFVTMSLMAKEMNRINVIKSWLNFPVMSFKTVWGIYYQAFLLYIKNIPFYTHPKKREIL